MKKFPELDALLSNQPIFIGIGNEFRGDDAAGIELVQKLISAGYEKAIVVHGNPENYLHKISGIEGKIRIWVDIVNFEGKPGEFRIFSSEEIGQYAISTHNFSPVVLVKYLNTTSPLMDFFLGIQPKILTLGNPMSKPVKTAVDILSEYIAEKLKL